MKFSTPCFVRVENPQERKELIKWLKSIGYCTNHIGCDRDNLYEIVLHVSDKRLYTLGIITDFPHFGAHNCGTNIPLFKALAAMNDKNDSEQWFVCESAMSECRYMVGTFELSSSHAFPRIDGQGTFWRKATSTEIIEHFKTQKS